MLLQNLVRVSKPTTTSELHSCQKPPVDGDVECGGPKILKMHKHQCGDDNRLKYEGFNPEKGCGRIFEHDETSHGIAAEHMCPDCKRGPWMTKLPEGKSE